MLELAGNQFGDGGKKMASSVYSKLALADEEAAWHFLVDLDAWAVLMPGYLHHEFTSEHEMIWVFKGDFGFVQKAIKIQLIVKERLENEQITFDLIGLSDNINGSGYFKMNEVANEQYEVVGNLEMKASGFLAAMINPVLEDVLPKLVEQLVDAIVETLSKQVV